MELKVDIAYEQLVELIKQLPESQIIKLKKELDEYPMPLETHEEGKGLTFFQELLLKGPVMSDEEYQTFLENRKHMNQWRKAS